MSIKDPGELGRGLRSGSSLFLRRRRGILGLTFFSSTLLSVTSLYQMGILERLPQPRWCGFNSEKVNGSAQAYSILCLPDGLLGFASYAITACLVGAGPENRSQTNAWLPVSMGLKLLTDALAAGKLTLDECRKIHAFSLWSLLTAGATFVALPLALPEVKAAVNRLARKEV
jgi:hypothetical protein